MQESLQTPLVKLIRDNGDPEWKQIIDLFHKHGLKEPPHRLRDELTVMLLWARYGEQVAVPQIRRIANGR